MPYAKRLFNQWDSFDSQPLGIEKIEATSERVRGPWLKLWLFTTFPQIPDWIRSDCKWEDNLRSTYRTILDIKVRFERLLSQLIQLQNKLVGILKLCSFTRCYYFSLCHYVNLGLLKFRDRDIVKLYACLLMHEQQHQYRNFSISLVSEQHNHSSRSAYIPNNYLTSVRGISSN